MLIELLTVAIISQPKPIIEPPKKVETTQIEKKKELTLEQKIERNYYKCNETTHFIRADNARCKLKPVYSAPKPQTPVKTAYVGSGGVYSYRSCTWWVAQWRDVPPGLGNANTWGDRWPGTVSDTPVVGAVAWSTRGYYGHVALVVAVDGDTITIKEGNYNWQGNVRTKTVPASTYRYLY